MSSSDEECGATEQFVEYCPECSMPPEYCEFSPCYKKCKVWLEQNHPDLLEGMEAMRIEEGKKKKGKNKGGGGGGGGKKKGKEPRVVISKDQRNKRKFTTLVVGMETVVEGKTLKEVAKAFSKRFACSASVTKTPNGQAITIQGDMTYDLPDVMVNKFGVDKTAIFFAAKGGKTKRAFPTR